MNGDEFWELIDRSGRNGHKKQVDELLKLLENETAERIIAFQQHLDERMCETYRWDLWGVAYCVNGGCGPELFEYFCEWLICQGADYYRAALATPERAADCIEPGGGVIACPQLLSAPTNAYRNKVGNEMPMPPKPVRPDEPIGDSWFKEDLELLYPELWIRYGWSESDSGADHPRSRAYQRRQMRDSPCRKDK